MLETLAYYAAVLVVLFPIWGPAALLALRYEMRKRRYRREVQESVRRVMRRAA